MIRRAVVDSSMLQAPALRAWLAEGPGNIAVLPDYLWLQIYKQETVAGLDAAFSVIRDFPDRLAVLKPSEELAGLDPSHSDLVEQMLRPCVAGEVRMLGEAISLAQQGEPEVMARLREKWSSAVARMDDMLEGAGEIIQPLPAIDEAFSADDIRRCHANGEYTAAMFETVFRAADQLYETFLRSFDATPGHRSPENRYDAYLYRLALAVIIYALWWIRSDSSISKSLEPAGHESVDLGLAVYGTYFAGLITEDAKARWMHDNLSTALRMIGARQGLGIADIGSDPRP